ncbi:MAG: hypothetical protein ACE5D6_04980 [Candidatus Zixiibacteriota bacterium]
MFPVIWKKMATYLKLFEQAIKRQAEVVGEELAFEQAKKAGLGFSKDGHIVSCTGNPEIVLLKLIKFFTARGNLLALVECTPLINEFLKKYKIDVEDIENTKDIEKTKESIET